MGSKKRTTCSQITKTLLSACLISFYLLFFGDFWHMAVLTALCHYEWSKVVKRPPNFPGASRRRRRLPQRIRKQRLLEPSLPPVLPPFLPLEASDTISAIFLPFLPPLSFLFPFPASNAISPSFFRREIERKKTPIEEKGVKLSKFSEWRHRLEHLSDWLWRRAVGSIEMSVEA